LIDLARSVVFGVSRPLFGVSRPWFGVYIGSKGEKSKQFFFLGIILSGVFDFGFKLESNS